MLFALAFSAGALAAGEGRGPIRIRVESRELHAIDPRLFGQFLERPSWGETGPEASADARGNLPGEMLDMLRAMRIPIIRFPGGTDIDYTDWTDMISREGERPVTTGHRGDKVTNRFGYDEYLRVAAELKWQSILVVNFLDALTKKKPLVEAARHAAGLVAYVNAPVGATLPPGMPDWPALRAKNGHAEPYGVKIFQLGNEWWGFHTVVTRAPGVTDRAALADWYRECIVAYADAMRAVDPGIELIIDARMGDRGLEESVLAASGIRQRVRYAALHRYSPTGVTAAKRDGVPVPLRTLTPGEAWLALAATPGTYEAGVCTAFGAGVKFPRSLGYEIAATEWNWNGWGDVEKLNLGAGVDYRHAAAIGTAGFLNGMLRQGDAVRIASQSMLVGHKWQIAAIQAGRDGGYPTHYNAQGAVTTFYNLHHGDRLLAVRTENVPDSPQPLALGGASPIPRVALLDVVATRNDRSIFVHAVNRGLDADLDAELDLTALAPADGPAVMHILEGVPRDQVAACKGWMTERSQPVRVMNGRVRVVFPRRTVTIVDTPSSGGTYPLMNAERGND